MPEVFSQIPDNSTQWYLTDVLLDHLKPPPEQYKPNCRLFSEEAEEYFYVVFRAT